MKKIFTFVLLTASFSLIAQTGPGGVGNSSNNVVWLDGDIVTTGTHPDIATWPDQSGNGNDFSQGSSTRQPRIVTYSGFNGVRFDGGDWLRTGGIAALNTNRKIIGIDSKKEYLDFCVERIEKHTKTQDTTSNLEGFLK